MSMAQHEVCRSLIATDGVCTEIRCCECPGSRHFDPAGTSCEGNGWSTPDSSHTDPDPKIVESATKWLEVHKDEAVT